MLCTSIAVLFCPLSADAMIIASNIYLLVTRIMLYLVKYPSVSVMFSDVRPTNRQIYVDDRCVSLMIHIQHIAVVFPLVVTECLLHTLLSDRIGSPISIQTYEGLKSVIRRFRINCLPWRGGFLSKTCCHRSEIYPPRGLRIVA